VSTDERADLALVLFDIDDTLLDDASAQRAAAMVLHRHAGMDVDMETFLDLWSATSHRHYARYLQGELDFQGQRRARMREAVDGALSDAAADILFDSYLDAYESAWALFADVNGCLDALGGQHRLGVVSNGQGPQQRRKLEALGIADRFACIVISGELGHRKPSPAIFLEACARLGTAPRGAVYVGDRYEIDALGARSAGLTGVWLDRLGARENLHLPPVISSLSDLQDVLVGLGLD
jgi:putative hydrolase of the HAD superfamily